MLKTLHYHKHNYTLHSPNHRDQLAAIKFGGKHALRWLSAWTGWSSKHHPTRGPGADLCCRNSYKGLHLCFPAFLLPNPTLPGALHPLKAWASVLTESLLSYQWIGLMTDLSGFVQNTWKHCMWFHMDHPCLWPAVTSGLGSLVHVPSASRAGN